MVLKIIQVFNDELIFTILRKVKNGIRKMAKMFSAKAFSGFSGGVYPSPVVKKKNYGVKRIFPLWSQGVKKNVARSPSAISHLSEVKKHILTPTLSRFEILNDVTLII